MEITSTKLSGLCLIKPKRFSDYRGFFAETYNYRSFSTDGLDIEFVQDNHSVSVQPNTLRGLHYQKPPNAQCKLVRCGRGVIFDVAVDLRKHSPTYGDWVGFELSEFNGLQLYIPAGFAHGFLSLVPNSEIVYKCSDYYAPKLEATIRWNDPCIGIDWPTNSVPILSNRDAEAPYLSDIVSPF